MAARVAAWKAVFPRNYLAVTAQYLASGMANVNSHHRDLRLAICRACEMHVVLAGQLRCRHPFCGCHPESKAWRKSSRCPLEKWPDPISPPEP